MHPSAATAWSNAEDSSYFDVILTPWNLATIREIVGKGSKAGDHLLCGKDKSILQGLPNFSFSVSFLTALGLRFNLHFSVLVGQLGVENEKGIFLYDHPTSIMGWFRLTNITGSGGGRGGPPTTADISRGTFFLGKNPICICKIFFRVNYCFRPCGLSKITISVH
ncbi:hypothetical protein HanXRQr2_Chr11g0508041 [Helianthus annuus]|uniref:Uncharacterized protein n=1 Tax=Helianthus annuus TaxID=4232 RepID=A0A9K3HS10_HELAN|nr:hypothetical protein HanXRQr2_Chr11g0508041 [Helianthus annuus]